MLKIRKYNRFVKYIIWQAIYISKKQIKAFLFLIHISVLKFNCLFVLIAFVNSLFSMAKFKTHEDYLYT